MITLSLDHWLLLTATMSLLTKALKEMYQKLYLVPQAGFGLKRIDTTNLSRSTINALELNQFQPSVAFHIETSHLFCRAKQMTGFYMKRNTGLKWVNSFQANACFLFPLKNIGFSGELKWEHRSRMGKSQTLNFQTKLFYLLQWKPFKNDEKCFLFHLKSYFRSRCV